MRGISKKGIAIKSFTLSWIMVAGILITIPTAVWAFFFLPKNSADQNTASEQSQTTEENQQAADSSKQGGTGSKSSGSKKSGSSSSGSTSQNGSGGGSTNLVLVALGDSITNANSPSSSMVGDNKSYSFSTGSNINSLYNHLINSGLSVAPYNLAVSGAKSADMLSGQVPTAVSLNPNYVTILIGGNDMLSLLSGEPVTPEQFQSNLSAAANQIKASGRRVLLGTIPNYGVMWQAGYPACANYPYDPALVSWAIDQYNSIISGVALSSGSTLVDLYPYLGTGDVSDYDCLHPNLTGQQKIANRFIAGL